MSVEGKRAAEWWAELSSSSTSPTAYIEGFESLSNKAFNALDEIISLGKLTLKYGVAEGYPDPDFASSV